jgi:hypothetical protein
MLHLLSFRFVLCQSQIVIDHQFHELIEIDFRLPA